MKDIFIGIMEKLDDIERWAFLHSLGYSEDAIEEIVSIYHE